ncbi:MAG: peptidylprolyl isomerase [Thiohalomonadales bacterium]
MSDYKVEKNMVVSMTYVILDQDGTVLEQSDIPISYIHGVDERVFDKIVNSLEGSKIDDEVVVQFEPDEAFGAIDPDLIYTDELNNVPSDFHQIGAEAEFQNDSGEKKTMIVTKMEHGKITLDGNHPLAGKHVDFKITIRAVRPASEQELSSGEVEGGSFPPTVH